MSLVRIGEGAPDVSRARVDGPGGRGALSQVSAL
jgi:hypothetical protein